VTVSTKTQLRRELRRRRAALPSETARRAAAQLVVRLAATRWFRTARHIACYLANDGEIDTTAIIERILSAGKRCYLPVLARRDHDRLWFAPYEDGAPLRANRYGILEPVVPARRLVRAQALDLVLLPCVAFDPAGRRLGMGGGFYDRSLAFLGLRRHWRHPQAIGLAYEFQRLENLPADPWDVPLDGIVTEERVYYFAVSKRPPHAAAAAGGAAQHIAS
jgi:5-formyltetrahydrofolate cyclo-ligase